MKTIAGVLIGLALLVTSAHAGQVAKIMSNREQTSQFCHEYQSRKPVDCDCVMREYEKQVDIRVSDFQQRYDTEKARADEKYRDIEGRPGVTEEKVERICTILNEKKRGKKPSGMGWYTMPTDPEKAAELRRLRKSMDENDFGQIVGYCRYLDILSEREKGVEAARKQGMNAPPKLYFNRLAGQAGCWR